MSDIDCSEDDDNEDEEEQEINYENDDGNDNDSGELNVDSLDGFDDDDFESANDNFLVYLEVDSTHEQEFEETDNIPPASAAVCTGYKIVGDNIDKNIQRTHQRIDRTTRSLHYFYMCAVKDRVDFFFHTCQTVDQHKLKLTFEHYCQVPQIWLQLRKILRY